MLRDPNWFRNLWQLLVAESFTKLFEELLRRSLSPPVVFRGLQQLDSELHMGASALLRLADEAADNRLELRRQLLLHVFVALPRPQRLFLSFLRLCGLRRQIRFCP